MDDRFEKEISIGNVNSCIAILEKEKDISKTIETIRSKGYFRCSRYEYRIDTLCKLYRFIIEHFELKKEEKTYLTSIYNSWHIGCSLRKYRNVAKVPTNKLKEFLALCDYCFLLRQAGVQPPHAEFEIIAESISTIIYESTLKNTAIVNHPIQLEKKDLQCCSKIVEIVSFIKQFKELEVKIDNLNYCVARHKSTYEISGDVERSLKMGYILTENARMIDYINYTNDGDITIEEQEASDRASRFFGSLYTKKTSDACTRFTWAINKPQELKKVLTFLLYPHWYADEKIDFLNLCKDFHIQNEEILQDDSYLGICVVDILKFQRLFRLISKGFKFFLDKTYGESWFDDDTLKPLIWQSIIPVMSKDYLFRILKFIFNAEKARVLMNLFCWEKTNPSQKYFDLQTSPIVMLGDYLYLLPNLTANSDLLRNILYSKRIRFDSNSEDTPLENTLEALCQKKSYFYKKNASYDFSGVKGEIDFLMVLDDEIFIFECKNSLIPTDSFQLRTSSDYIAKASKQLRIFKENSKNAELLQYLKKKFGVPVEVNSITTGIVMGNRMFCGCMINEIIVCNIFELFRFIDTGKVHVQEKEFSLWRSKNLSAFDLKKYLSEDSYIVRRLSDLTPFEKKEKFEGKSIISHSYYLDLTDAKSRIETLESYNA